MPFADAADGWLKKKNVLLFKAGFVWQDTHWDEAFLIRGIKCSAAKRPGATL